MASALLGSIAPELEALLARLAGGGATGLIGRIGASALGGFLASEIINALKGPNAATAKRVLPRFAIVDLHDDTVVKYLSKPRVYRLLTRPRGLGKHTRRPNATQNREIIVVPQGVR